MSRSLYCFLDITKLRRAKDGLEQQVEELLDQYEGESKQKAGLDKLRKKLEGEVDEMAGKTDVRD